MEKNGLKNVIYDHLLAQICSGSLGPNTSIVEQDISRLLNTSRTPVREALKQLEMEGLVTHIPARGTFVRELTLQDINEIFQIRKLFEMAALTQAVHLIPDEELDEMEKELLSISESSNEEESYNADRHLHSTILKYAYNTRMVAFYNTLNVQNERILRISAKTPQGLATTKAEHLAIVRAIRSRDLDASSQALSSHISTVHKSALRVFESMRMGLKV